MDIKNIKPSGNFGQIPEPSADTTVQSGRNGAFAETIGKTSTAAAGAGATATGLSAVSQFDRATLQDPAKLDQAVRASVAELVDSGQLSNSMTPGEKQSLVDFLSNDPAFRAQVESYLRKVIA